MNVDPEYEQEFNEWYDNEHIPGAGGGAGDDLRAAVPGLKGTHRYLALYHLKSPDVPLTAAWKKAAGTPWTERLRPHFRDHMRILTKRYVRGG